jgi:DNA-binding GntR family transcriptional regulator
VAVSSTQWARAKGVNGTITVKEKSKTTSPSGLKSSLVERIRDGIVSQKYKAGARLNETSLAREFRVSRIQVREALMQLEERGLAVSQPRRGMFVNNLSEVETQQITSVRLVLEAEALKLCRAQISPEMTRNLNCLVTAMDQWQSGSQLEAAELDLEFHRAIWHYSGNRYLEKALNTLAPILFAHRALDGISDERMRWILNHHRSLLNVVEGVSRESPEEAILAHLRAGYKDPERFSSLAL